MNSSAKVEGMVGSPFSCFSYRRDKDSFLCLYNLAGYNPSTYLGPSQLLLDDVVVRFHMSCEFQIADGVLMTAVDALKSKNIGARVTPFMLMLHINHTIFTVSGGRRPRISIKALYICSAVPSKNLPHPATNSVSPVQEKDMS